MGRTPDKMSRWRVDKRIFGKFFETNGRDTYPGIIEDCIANGSFEMWHSKRKKDGTNLPWTMRTEIMYRDTPLTPGLAYPWEPVNYAEGAFAQPEGGVHGKQEWRRFQRFSLTGRSEKRGIAQRITLHDERTLEYRLQLYARASSPGTRLYAALEDKEGARLAVGTVQLGADWQHCELRLVLSRASAHRYNKSPFGEYRLVLTAEADGAGDVDLDWVMLASGDAVEGMFNPATIELLRKYHVTSIRWGGNYANEYNWKDGIGPWQQRPVRNNLNWGGLEPNYFGTNEFLQFCRLVGAEPFLNVGFSYDLPPELAAEWVEYVNGSVDTPMGKLRAEHGYPEPWGVKLWQIGNESYGDYQFGYTNSSDFAHRIQTYYAMMKKADPTVTIVVAGEDPMYVDYSEIPGEPPIWNRRLFEIAGPAYVDGLDIHQYTRGIRDAGLRREWLERNEADPVFYNQVLVAYPTQYEALIRELKQLADGYGFKPLVLEIGEWNLEPETDADWPKAEYETMAHACYVASMFNTFIRQGDSVKFAYQRDNTLYSRAYPVDMRPVNPGNDTSRLYAEPFLRADTGWRRLDIETEATSFDMPQTWVRIRSMANIPHIDAAAVVSDGGDEIVLFAANRDLNSAQTLTIEGDWQADAVQMTVKLQSGDTPFLRQDDWYAGSGYRVADAEPAATPDGRFELTMPAGSVARMTIKLK
jgi:alpha-N-arabinofuranosidase